MLICNYSYINQICGHNHSGVTNPVWVIAPHTMRGYFGKAQTETVSDQTRRDSFPTGTNPPYSYILGDKGALLSATTQLNGSSTLTANMAMGINLVANLEGSGSITGNLSLVVALTASLVGSGSITAANMVGTVALASTLVGSGNITAGLSLIANMNASLQGVGSLSANLRGTASLQANIFVNSGTATINELVDGVWNALAADFNNVGTMGNKLNSAGGAADPLANLVPGAYGPGTAGEALGLITPAVDPWATPLPGAYNSGEAGYILGNLLSNIPDEVWNELKTTHTTASSYGKIIQDLETLAKQIKALTAAQL